MLFQSRSALSNARSSAYPQFIAVVSGKSAMYVEEMRGEDGPLLIHLNLFCWASLVFKTTLRIEISSTKKSHHMPI